MVTAFVLTNAERDRIAPAAQEVLAIPGVAEVYSVAGRYDLVAVARVKTNDELAGLVTQDLIKVRGITCTATLIAFRQSPRRPHVTPPVPSAPRAAKTHSGPASTVYTGPGRGAR